MSLDGIRNALMAFERERAALDAELAAAGRSLARCRSALGADWPEAAREDFEATVSALEAHADEHGPRLADRVGWKLRQLGAHIDGARDDG